MADAVTVKKNESGRMIVRFELDCCNPSLKVSLRQLKTRAIKWVKENLHIDPTNFCTWDVLRSTQFRWGSYCHEGEQIVGSWIHHDLNAYLFILSEKQK